MSNECAAVMWLQKAISIAVITKLKNCLESQAFMRTKPAQKWYKLETWLQEFINCKRLIAVRQGETF